MLIRRKYFVLQTGYDITTDLHHGFNIGFTRAWKLSPWLLICWHYGWPQLIWYNRYYAVNESGYLRGFPVARPKAKWWLLRGIRWPHQFRVIWR